MSPAPAPGRRAHPARAAALVGAALVAGALVARVFWSLGSSSLAAVTADGPDTPADLLLTGACAIGLALTTWLVLGVLLSVAAALPGAVGRLCGSVADRLAPALVRRAVAAALGGALVAGLPATAHAGSLAVTTGPVASAVSVAPAPDPAFVVTGKPPVVDGSTSPTPTTDAGSHPTASPTSAASSTGPTAPDPAFGATSETPGPSAGSMTPRASATTAPAARPAPTLGPLGPAPGRSTSVEPAPAAASEGTVRVHRGDSLWAIAARHLGPGATPAAIAREWPRWYAANRAVVGADPDLIVPGQVLVAPTPSSSSVSSSTQQGAPS